MLLQKAVQIADSEEEYLKNQIIGKMNKQFLTTCLTLIFLGFCCTYSYQGLAQSTDNFPDEEVLVQVVNPVSLTEEYLWMEVSVNSGNKPSPSKVIYMELLDRNGISVAGDLAKLENGKVNSYLQIPLSFPPTIIYCGFIQESALIFQVKKEFFNPWFLLLTLKSHL